MQIDRVRAALDNDFNSQGAYTGRVIQKEEFTVLDHEGNPIHVERDVIISWDTIQKILALVKDRAGV